MSEPEPDVLLLLELELVLDVLGDAEVDDVLDAGLAALVPVELLPLELPLELDVELSALPPPESFLVEPYRSEYQPPPLSTKELRLTRFTIVPSAPHCSHFAGAGSDTFCNRSISLPHFSQAYS